MLPCDTKNIPCYNYSCSQFSGTISLSGCGVELYVFLFVFLLPVLLIHPLSLSSFLLLVLSSVHFAMCYLFATFLNAIAFTALELPEKSARVCTRVCVRERVRP